MRRNRLKRDLLRRLGRFSSGKVGHTPPEVRVAYTSLRFAAEASSELRSPSVSTSAERYLVSSRVALHQLSGALQSVRSASVTSNRVLLLYLGRYLCYYHRSEPQACDTPVYLSKYLTLLCRASRSACAIVQRGISTVQHFSP